MKWLLANRTGSASADALTAGLDLVGEQWDMVDPSAWSDHYWIDCDIAVAFGARHNETAFLASAKRRNVPTAVVDLGYVNRFDHNFRPVFDRDRTLQISVGSTVGCIPEIECPPDRRLRLGLTYPGLRNAPDGPIVVFGQWPNDPTHPFSDAASILAWVDEIRAQIGGVPVKYRPHPRLMGSDEFLDDALRTARVVVTWSSNSGNDALIAGIPVASHAGPYRSIVAGLSELAAFCRNPSFPSAHDWEAYFNRLAYGQWSFAEFADGSAVRFARALLVGEDPFAARTTTGGSVRRADRIVISGCAGLGDNAYQRPFVRAAAARSDVVYLMTPYPEIYEDIENVRFVADGSTYRCARKNIERTDIRFADPPADAPTVIMRYSPRDLAQGNILDTFGRQLPMIGAPFVMDLPSSGESRVAREIGAPFVVVRPVTHRREWDNESRAPLSEYIAEAAAIARARGYIVVSVADVDGENERLVGTPPIADVVLHSGECDTRELIALTRAASAVIGGVGWAVPFCLALGTPMLCVLGGCGAHNAPHIIAPPTMIDASRVVWAIPDRFCMCDSHHHDCDKRITGLPAYVDQLLSMIAPPRAQKRSRRGAARASKKSSHRAHTDVPKFAASVPMETSVRVSDV